MVISHHIKTTDKWHKEHWLIVTMQYSTEKLGILCFLAFMWMLLWHLPPENIVPVSSTTSPSRTMYYIFLPKLLRNGESTAGMLNRVATLPAPNQTECPGDALKQARFTGTSQPNPSARKDTPKRSPRPNGSELLCSMINVVAAGCRGVWKDLDVIWLISLLWGIIRTAFSKITYIRNTCITILKPLLHNSEMCNHCPCLTHVYLQ